MEIFEETNLSDFFGIFFFDFINISLKNFFLISSWKFQIRVQSRPDFWMFDFSTKTLKTFFFSLKFYHIFFKKKKKSLKKFQQKIPSKKSALKKTFHVPFITHKVRMKKKYHTKLDKIWERQKKKVCYIFQKFFLGFPDFQSLEFQTLFQRIKFRFYTQSTLLFRSKIGAKIWPLNPEFFHWDWPAVAALDEVIIGRGLKYWKVTNDIKNTNDENPINNWD